MSIDPIVSVESYTALRSAAPPDDTFEVTPAEAAARAQQVQQLQEAQAAASAAQDLNGVGVLTANDRDFLSYLYGPDVLDTLGIDRPTQTPQFVLDLIDARRTGELPSGTDITSSFVQNRFDAYLAATGTGTIQNPVLTPQELTAAQEYFNRRVAGAAVDLQV